MSELITTHDNRATIRWKLLTGASALALTGYIVSASAADADRPTIWIELGGQLEQTEGASNPFSAPFMTANSPTPDVYKGISFTGSQKNPTSAFGEEATISFQPEDSDWIFSAGIRYGRAHANRHKHNQSAPAQKHYHFTVNFTSSGIPYHYSFTGTVPRYPSAAAFADANTQVRERHLVLDFTAGKDVGLGLFGRQGSSVINAGVRFASFSKNVDTNISARPSVFFKTKFIPFYSTELREYYPAFRQYHLSGSAQRSFKGVGPTLSWQASAAIAGNEQDGELTFDWGVNAALLFGKQKARTSHHTSASKFYILHAFGTNNAGSLYPSRGNHSTRSRNVTVPNVGAFAGLSLKWTNAKISFGYRDDTFLSAMDTGIDAAKKSNVSFNGPFASISIGLGD